ncbi:MAG: hypothetical protein MJ180_03870 [Candidatus Gastranaerophilales bacterium]|nr:hypothetical protein [Candidatus Gastranaerophilales bacterium]
MKINSIKNINFGKFNKPNISKAVMQQILESMPNRPTYFQNIGGRYVHPYTSDFNAERFKLLKLKADNDSKVIEAKRIQKTFDIKEYEKTFLDINI